MKQQKSRVIRRICAIVGVCILVMATAWLIAWQWQIHTAEQQAGDYVQTLRTLMPTPQSTVLEARRDNTMATLSLNGNNFVGILEMPQYASALPIGASFGDTTQYPCRFDGSVYDGSLQIGATTQKGQYAFYREISVGDTVFFTDVEGNRYQYTVIDLRYEQHADQAALQRVDAPLTLFIKNVYAFEYLVVFCDVLQ